MESGGRAVDNDSREDSKELQTVDLQRSTAPVEKSRPN
jgi:hypothetical protein